jgi:hypothetical protein
MANFAFYQDSDLTTVLSGNLQIPEGVNDGLLYFGSNETTLKLQKATSPGITSIYVTITDANSGSGAEASWVKLAVTKSGLDSASAGESLSLGSTIYGGAVNAVPIWIRTTNYLTGASVSTDITLTIVDVKEYVI